MFANLTIARKLFAGFVVILLIIAVLTLTTWRSLNAINDSIAMNDHSYSVTRDAATLLTSLIDIETGMRGFALTGNRDFLVPLTEGRLIYQDMHARLMQLTADDPEQQSRLVAINELYQSWTDNDIDALIALRRRQDDGFGNPAVLPARIAEERDKEKMDGMRSLLNEFMSAELALSAQHHQTMTDTQSRAMLFLYTGGALAVFFSVLIAWGLSRDISGRLEALLKAARRISEGHLDTQLNFRGRDEISHLGHAFATMQNRLRLMIGEISEGSERLLSSSAQISNASGQLAAATREQAQAAGTMAATVEELTVSIGHVSESAGTAHKISAEAGQQSQQGGEVIQRTLDSMHSIAQTVQDTAARITELDAHSVHISSIIKVIQEIAEQTNLLALNAAIEAARAGEQGRGFAVVADEVRQLSQRTSASTKEIADMVRKIQQGTHDAVSQMNIGVEKVNAGVTLASQAGEAILQIQGGAGHVARVVDQISLALREQDSASQEVGRTVERIAHMSEENSQAVGEATSAAQDLQRLAADLRKQVAQFNL